MTNLSNELLLLFGFPLEGWVPAMVAFIFLNRFVVVLERICVESRFPSLACSVKDHWLINQSYWKCLAIRDMVRVVRTRVAFHLVHRAHGRRIWSGKNGCWFGRERQKIRSQVGANNSVLISQRSKDSTQCIFPRKKKIGSNIVANVIA